MFYAHYVLSKKGPLAKVWLAAHWDKKLTKAHVFETDVEKTVDNIISPKVKMALRTSGHLLLGVVRIYSRKQKYLIQDLGEACAKIKMAFRPGVVDLPVEGVVANTDTITLPEIFHDFETAVADLNTLDIDEQMAMHRSRAEEITLKDDFIVGSTGMFTLDDEFQSMENEFGGMLEDIEIPRKSTGLERSGVSDLSQLSLPTGDDKNAGQDAMEVDRNHTLDDGRRADGFGNENGFLDDGFGDFGQGGLQEDLLNMPGLDDINLDQPPPPESNEMEVDGPPPQVVDEDHQNKDQQKDIHVEEESAAPLIPANETIRENDGFVLEPLDVSVKMRQRRKRKLVVDSSKELTGNQIRAQLKDHSDIIQPKPFPPPSKKALLWREFGTSDYLLNNPGLSWLSSDLVGLVCSNLENVDEDAVVDSTLLDLDEADVEIPRKDGEVNESAVNDSVALPPQASPPRDLNNVPPSDMPLKDDRVEPNGLPPPFDPIDFIDNIDMEGENPTSEKIVPEMPDFDVEEGEKENEEAESNLTQSTADQHASERTDEFEQRRWTKRSQQMLNMLEKGFSNSETIQFSTLTKKCSRKVAASRFYTCLLLGKEGAIRFTQEEPFAPISITRGSMYSNVVSV